MLDPDPAGRPDVDSALTGFGAIVATAGHSPWPDWALTTTIDATGVWEKVWRAVSCHASQLASYDGLPDLSPERHRALWGTQSFYRVFSRVNGGRTRETDLFAGVAR